MAPIDEIRHRFALGEVEFTRHAVVRSLTRNIAVKEVQEAIAGGEIIEDYPDDKYGPSCLIFGRTGTGRPLHVHCSNPSREILKVITIYEPDSNEWIEFRRRR